MKKNSSREQLTKSLDRRIKHLMIGVLEKFEDRFAELDETRDGQVFKGDIRNAFNDVIRAQRDELRDYDVEYRPLQLTNDNILAVTQTFLRTVQKINFGFTAEDHEPYVEFCGDQDSFNVLNALRLEIEAGVMLRLEDGCTLLIVGTETIVNSVLPIMDRYRLHTNVATRYQDWRDQVIKIYRS